MTVCRRADRLTLAISLQTIDDSLRVWLQFADIQQFQALTFSSGGGLGMGVSDIADCLAKYKRTEGGIEVLSDFVVFALCTALRPLKRHQGGSAWSTSLSVASSFKLLHQLFLPDVPLRRFALTATQRTTGALPPRAAGAFTMSQAPLVTRLPAPLTASALTTVTMVVRTRQR